MESYSESYRKAGVDITAGYQGVQLMGPHVARTMIPGVVSGIGGCGGLFALGLTGMAEDEKIADTLKNAKTLALAGDALLTLALEGGGRDNITVALFTRGAEEEA